MLYSEKWCQSRKELNNYDFFAKLNDLNKASDDSDLYDQLQAELKAEFPNEQASYLKVESWLKKTLEDNQKHSKFLLDDGEMDVEMDWVQNCNQLIEDQDKGKLDEF